MMSGLTLATVNTWDCGTKESISNKQTREDTQCRHEATRKHIVLKQFKREFRVLDLRVD